MPFITAEDYNQYIEEHILESITDIEDTFRTMAEETAISLVTDHLSARYDVVNIFNKTGSARHASVVWAVCQISLFHLHQRVHPDAVPEHRQRACDSAKKWLRGVRDCELNPVGLPLLPDGSKDYVLYGGETKRSNRLQ